MKKSGGDFPAGKVVNWGKQAVTPKVYTGGSS